MVWKWLKNTLEKTKTKNVSLWTPLNGFDDSIPYIHVLASSQAVNPLCTFIIHHYLSLYVNIYQCMLLAFFKIHHYPSLSIDIH